LPGLGATLPDGRRYRTCGGWIRVMCCPRSLQPRSVERLRAASWHSEVRGDGGREE
jgi:hypothetical protein